MKRLTVLEIPGGKVGLYVDLEKNTLDAWEVHTSAKLRVRLELQSPRWFHIHVYRRNRSIISWEVTIGSDGAAAFYLMYAAESLSKYTYGRPKSRSAVAPAAAHEYVRMPSDPAGEARAEEAKLP
jgi:hypothetical protein